MTQIQSFNPTPIAAASAATPVSQPNIPGEGDVFNADVQLQQGRHGYLLQLPEPKSFAGNDGEAVEVSYLLMDPETQAAIHQAVQQDELQPGETIESMPLEVVAVGPHEVTVGLPR